MQEKCSNYKLNSLYGHKYQSLSPSTRFHYINIKGFWVALISFLNIDVTNVNIKHRKNRQIMPQVLYNCEDHLTAATDPAGTLERQLLFWVIITDVSRRTRTIIVHKVTKQDINNLWTFSYFLRWNFTAINLFLTQFVVDSNQTQRSFAIG